ncbi:MAG: hypothetical protein HY841_08710 [Bacteroidetes bacterium]|nr:hypothetical protein [Bacteroidota bacterium]
MKKISTLTVACALAFFSKAGVLTVNNNSNSPGQYTSLQTAIDSASAGDSIYVHGSATSYSNVSIKKQLTLLGTGHNPNKTNNLISEIGIILLDTINGISGASGTKIIGFKLNRVSGFGGSGGTKNIFVSRNYFISGGSKIIITGKGWTIENNIINSSSVTVSNNSNVIIRNNIFNNASIVTSNQPSVLIANNIFFGTSPLTCFTTLSNALIANNIFSGSSPKGANVNTNTFNNNITYQTAYDTIPFGTNSGSGNILAQNPLYTNVASTSFSYSYDFSLQATSPGKNAGTDGTDLGIYGGAMPFVDMTGSPAIPQMKLVSILNPMIPAGDSLHVIIKAKKQN